MSALCGWTGFTASPEQARHLLEKMAAALPGNAARAPTLLTGQSSALAFASSGHIGSVYHDDNHLAVIEGHPIFIDPVLARLAEQHGAAQALMTGYREHGVDIPRLIKGHFSLAILEIASQSVFLAVDRLAIRPMVFTVNNGCFIFGSSATAVTRHPNALTDINPQALFDYLYFHVVPIPESVYKGVQRLQPGGYALFARGKLTTGTYWEIEYSDPAQFSFTDLKREFVQLVEQGIHRLCGQGNVGAFLSGGTDSSTIAGMLTRVSGEPAKTYSIGFDAKGYDEMEYARISARHFNTSHHEYYVTPDDVVSAIPMIAAAYAEPYGNASAVPTFYCARQARADGIDLLLGGDGGDELFGGNERYATQWLFSLYSSLPGPLRRGLIEPLLFSLPFGDKIWPVRKARGYVRQANVPMPDRLQTYNLLSRLGVENVFTVDFLGRVDQNLPVSSQRWIYENARADGMLNRMLALDLKITLADNDLPKVNVMCALAGVDVAYPFLDDDVVAFSARLPSRLKLKGTRLRYFFKESLRDFLPPQTLTKVKHGFGLPFGVWLQTHMALKELANDNLRDLASRHIIRPDFITDLVERRLPEHPHYYGTMVWLLMMLEQWFKNDERRR